MRATTNGHLATVADFDPSARPPADALPKPLAALLTELDTMRGRIAEAEAITRDIDGHWATSLAEAKAADARASAKAARAGDLTAVTQDNAANLVTKRDRAHAELDSLKAAHSLIVNELHTARDKIRAAGDHTKTLEKARTRLADTLAPVHAAATAAIQAHALAQWIDGGAYDTTENVNAAELVPWLAGQVDGVHVAPVPITDVIAALRAITDDQE